METIEKLRVVLDTNIVLSALSPKLPYRHILRPILVDSFDWARLPETFHRNIEAQHEVLFSILENGVDERTSENGKL